MMALLSLSRTDCEEKPEETLERTVKSCYRSLPDGERQTGVLKLEFV